MGAPSPSTQVDLQPVNEVKPPKPPTNSDEPAAPDEDEDTKLAL